MSGRDVRPAPVKIMLDREREIRYDLNALVALEEKYGGLKELMTVKANLKNIRFLLWAGLIHEDPSLTEGQVGAMVEPSCLNEISEAVSRALMGAFPKNALTPGAEKQS